MSQDLALSCPVFHGGGKVLGRCLDGFVQAFAFNRCRREGFSADFSNPPYAQWKPLRMNFEEDDGRGLSAPFIQVF